MPNGQNAASGTRPTRALPTVALVVLFSVAAIVEAVRLSSLHNPDVWLHLRVGEWILANKTWPTTGLFSQASELVWRDFNWFADATLAMLYRVLGLSAVPALWMLYRMTLAAITFFLAGGSRQSFWVPAIVSMGAQYLLYDVSAVGAGTSAVLFGIVLLVLVVSRNNGKWRKLFWLPLLFLFWPNLDLGFVYGFGLFVLYLASLAIEGAISRTGANWFAKPGTETPLATATLVGVACLVASLLSPYGYQGFATFFAVQSSPANQYLFDHTAMTFHRPQDYVLLLLSMAAFLSLGLRRSRDLFLISIVIGCTGLSFRAQGDTWLATLAAVAAIGQSVPQTKSDALPQIGRRWFLVPATVSLAVLLLSWLVLVPRDRQLLLGRLSADFPVGACDYIRTHQSPVPLFNSYAWGGFLAWYLPEYPVAIDARRGLYPDDLETDYFKVMKVLIPYQALAPMKDARTLLLDKQTVMAEALRTLPGFQVAFEDNISIVLLQERRE
jgi:hypothetical protein